MEHPEIDPEELLAEIACPKERARTRREWGLQRREMGELDFMPQ